MGLYATYISLKPKASCGTEPHLTSTLLQDLNQCRLVDDASAT